jgi:hypothetical protein
MRCPRGYPVIITATYFYRSVSLHLVGERHAVFDWPTNSPMLARLIAALGEFTFADLICIVFAPDLRTPVFLIIGVAEVISCCGTAKQNYAWFAVENMIWVCWALCFMVIAFKAGHCLKVIPFLGLVLYNIFIDVPMYMSKHLDMTGNRKPQHYDQTIAQGLFWDAWHFRTVGFDDKVWQPHMLWMTLMFTGGPYYAIELSDGPLACSAVSAVHLAPLIAAPFLLCRAEIESAIMKYSRHVAAVFAVGAIYGACALHFTHPNHLNPQRVCHHRIQLISCLIQSGPERDFFTWGIILTIVPLACAVYSATTACAGQLSNIWLGVVRLASVVGPVSALSTVFVTIGSARYLHLFFAHVTFGCLCLLTVAFTWCASKLGSSHASSLLMGKVTAMSGIIGLLLHRVTMEVATPEWIPDFCSACEWLGITMLLLNISTWPTPSRLFCRDFDKVS